MKICFVLASSGNDSYPEMTRVSMALARRACPSATITLLTDEQTPDALPHGRRTVLDEADQVIRIHTGLEDQFARSRYVKTKVRCVTEGPVVFIDSDALVIKDITPITQLGADIAAAEDRIRNTTSAECPKWVQPYYQRFGWRYPVKTYFNSGVLFFSDSQATRTASRIWHERWLKAYHEAGLRQDQPALNSVLDEAGPIVHKLPVAYNAMVEADPWLAKDASVFHFFASADNPSYVHTLLSQLVEHLKLRNEINWDFVDEAIRTSDPWRHPTGWMKCELATGHYLNAAKLVAKRLLDGSYWTLYRNRSRTD